MGTVAASWSRMATTASSSCSSAMTCTRSSGLIWVSASPRSRSAGIQVQCAGSPARRSMPLMASTGSRLALSTMRGTALGSIKQTPWMRSKVARILAPGPWSSGVSDLAEGAAGGMRLAALSACRYHTRPFLRGRQHPAALESRKHCMASYTTSEIRSGLKVLLDGDPYSVVENEFVKPGKGQAFNRIKVRNLKTGRTIERTFKSGESLEAADVVDTEMQYLYQEGDFWHFMVPDNFEQYTAGKAAVAENAQWLKDGIVCIVTLWNGEPLVVMPPAHIDLKVVETDPGLRGDTATGGQKPAKLETGAVVRVPLFINEGEVLRIDTRTGEYISRAKQ